MKSALSRIEAQYYGSLDTSEYATDKIRMPRADRYFFIPSA
jgi:hypothetical protein